MATFTLKAGNHYHSWPPFSTLPWIGKQAIARHVTFSDSCRYDSAPYNSQDVNKLFGLSFGFGGVHGNSARFGWRWSMADKCIELLAYCYIEGQRNWDEQLRFPVVAQVQPGQKVLCTIEAVRKKAFLGTTLAIEAGDTFLFSVEAGGQVFTTEVRRGLLDCYGLTHGLYFGGEQPAPHTMAVEIDRL